MLSSAPVYPTLAVKDMDAATAFWVDKLGFRVRESTPDGGVVLEAGEGSRLSLYPSQFAGTNKATACAFDVTDIEQSVRDLRTRGIEFEEYDLPQMKTVNGIASTDDGRGAWFTDPDGNIIGVFQPTPVAARA